jgi:putative ABC transport system permease protein
MSTLAIKTLAYEWRRFLPAVLAVGFVCLLQLLQVAFVQGIFSSASVYITGSNGQLWVGSPGTQSVNLGRPVQEALRARLLMDAQVERVEPFIWLDADWRSDRGSASVMVSGIDARPEGQLFAKLLPAALRAQLQTPNTVIIDRADVDKLGVDLQGLATINGERVRVVGVTRGLRALGGINVLASLATARHLDTSNSVSIGPTYFVAQLKASADSQDVARRLCCQTSFGAYEVWTAPEFARRSELYWLLDTGAGAGVAFLAVIVFAAGSAICSQSLLAAVGSSMREYATLNALGVGLSSLRRVVLEQALWVGLLGVLLAAISGVGLLALALSQDVPVVLHVWVAVLCMLIALVVALISGLVAVQSLKRADPATLMR